MDFENEPFVKIYTTETPTVRYWGFWGTVLMEQLIKKANKAGVIELPSSLLEDDDLVPAIASIIGCGQDIEWVRKHLSGLMEQSIKRVVGNDGRSFLVISRYHDGQYGGIDPKFSKRWSAQKIKDTEEALENGLIEPPFWRKTVIEKVG